MKRRTFMFTRGTDSDCIFQGKKDSKGFHKGTQCGFLTVFLWKSTFIRWPVLLLRGTLFHWIGQVNNNLLYNNRCKNKQTVCLKVSGVNLICRYTLRVYPSGGASIVAKTLEQEELAKILLTSRVSSTNCSRSAL